MYSWEIKKLLEEYDYYIGGDILTKVTDIKENPQLRYICHNLEDEIYYMEDDQGEKFIFRPMPYTEAKERGLVKVKKVGS